MLLLKVLLAVSIVLLAEFLLFRGIFNTSVRTAVIASLIWLILGGFLGIALVRWFMPRLDENR